MDNICKLIVSFALLPLLLLISFSSTILAEESDSIVVKLNTTDCMLCYLRLEKLNEVQNSSITFVCHLNNLRACEKIIYKHIENDKVIILPSDSLYEAINSGFGSEIYLYKDGDLFFKTLLKDFSGFNPQIIKIDTITEIPNHIIISEFAKVIQYQEKFIINDPYNKSLLSYDIQKQGWIFHDFTKDNFIPRLLSERLIDTNELKLQESVKAVIKGKFSIEGIKLSAPYQVDSLLYYLISFYLPKRGLEIDNQVVLTTISAVISYNVLKDTIQEFFPLYADKDFNVEHYYKYQCAFLSENGKGLILVGYTSHKSDTIVYRIIDKDFEGQPMMIYGQLPDFYVHSGLYNNFSIPIARKDILFFPHSSEIILIPGFLPIGKLPFSNSVYKNKSLSDALNNLSFAVIDFCSFENALYTLHFNRKQRSLIQSIYNLDSNQVFNVLPISVPNSVGIYSLSYFSSDRLCGITTDNKYLITVKMNYSQ